MHHLVQRLPERLGDAAVAGTVAGVVRVAAFQTASINLIAPALGTVAARHPALRVEVVEAEPEGALVALAGREVDLALCDEYDHVPQPRPHGVVFDELHVESVRLAVPRDHPLASARAAVRLPSLAGERWAAGHPGSSHRRLVTHICDAYGGFAPDIHHQATDLLILLALVSSGRAVTLLPDLARPEREPAARICDLAEVPLRRRVFTAIRSDSVRRPALAALSNALRETARQVRAPATGRAVDDRGRAGSAAC